MSRPRRAHLVLKRIDPWTALKFSFVYGIAAAIVFVIVVLVLYGALDALGVIGSIRSFISDTDTAQSGQGAAAWLGFGHVFLATIVVAALNVVLFTAFATLAAFIYNVCGEIVGGVEVTLTDRQ